MKRLRVYLISGVLVAFAAALAAWHYKTKALPFEPAGWTNGDPRIRFRMKESLAAKYEAGEIPSRDVVDRLLGPDDDNTVNDGLRYYRLRQWDGNPWYLRVRFDNRGNVMELVARPD